MNLHRYWIMFDLGLMGNYEVLYKWLDENGAEECGHGSAMLLSNCSVDVLVSKIRETLKDCPRARVYLVCDHGEGRIGGKWILGGRRKAPWSGFSAQLDDEWEMDDGSNQFIDSTGTNP